LDDIEVLQYLFDLQGYLVIENALTADEVGRLNELLDRQAPPAPGKQRFGSAPDGPGFLEWGQPFCDLLDHPRVMPILRIRLGDCFRLDRIYGMRMLPGMPGGRLHSDYGASAPTSHAVPGQAYHPQENEMVGGFVVVSWNLTPTGPDHGGFCCIPGSHKSSFRIPQAVRDAGEGSPVTVLPRAPAGSVIVFTEALTHGTAAWRGPHERRSLLYKYCVSHVAWTARRVQLPSNTGLSERQKILFREPADPLRHFPSLFEGGETNPKA
jgi:hypothetical protein